MNKYAEVMDKQADWLKLEVLVKWITANLMNKELAVEDVSLDDSQDVEA